MVLTTFQNLLIAPSVTALVALGVIIPGLLLALSLRSKPVNSNGKQPHLLSTTLPILGNLVDVAHHIDDFHDWVSTLCEKYQGEPFRIVVPGQPLDMYVYTPEGVEECLKTNFGPVQKGPIQRELLEDFLGSGIFAVDGAKWVHQRKTASNLFTTRTLRETMSTYMRRYAVVLERILAKTRDSGETIDLFKLMNKFTIEAFAKMAFGINMDTLERDHDHPFQNAFDSVQRMLVLRFLRPMWFWKLQRMLNVGAERQLREDIAVIDRTVIDIVAHSLARRASGEAIKGGDIVSLFLDRFDDSVGEAFDPKYLRDIVVNFLIAGRDTTAQAMSWCFFELSQHPNIVSKVREELAHVLPDFVSGRRTEPPTAEEVQRLTYLDATLKETLRLHPSVPVLVKHVDEDIVFSDGMFVPAGTSISIPTYAMARQEFIWGLDAKQFKPERWIDPISGSLRTESAFKFVSFNAGPRICLGINLAMLEMKIVMASVLAKFNIELEPGQNVSYETSATLPVKGSMLVRVMSA